MSDCCDDKACALEALRGRQSATLKAVLAINAVMFVVELAAGLLAGSTALMSDALDNLGDALTYGASLYAVSRSAGAKARVALFKGSLILGAGLFVLAQVLYRIAVPAQPVFAAMGLVSLLALAANDIASNLAVFVAAGAVWLLEARWPDLAVGGLLALLFLRSALRVLREASLALDARGRPIS